MIKVNLPENLNEISLGNYQRYLSESEVLTDNEKGFKLIECLLSIDISTLYRFKKVDIDFIVNHITNLFHENKAEFQTSFWYKEIEFGFIPKLEEMSFGEYIDLENYLQKPDDFHKAMAVMYRPISKRVKDKYLIQDYEGASNYSEFMKFAPLGIFLSSQVFFYHLGLELLNAIPNYLEKEMKKMNRLSSRKKVNSQNNGDGIFQSMSSQMEILKGMIESLSKDYLSALPNSCITNKKQK